MPNDHPSGHASTPEFDSLVELARHLTALSDGAAQETLLEHQRRRWLAGRPVPVEEYLALDATLAADVERAVELVYAEVLLRQELGERPDREEYLRRFPHLAERLRMQFLLRDALASAGPPTSVATVYESQRPSASTGFTLADEVNAFPTVPGYEVLEELGRGGMGVVYKARQTSLNRIVALKVVRDRAPARPEARLRFLAEAEVIARLRHPNVVQVYEFGEHQGQPFFSLEYLDGGSLADRLANGPLAPREAAALVLTLANAVDHAHRQGIIHRDLKPANILLTVLSSEFQVPSGEEAAPAPLRTHNLELTTPTPKVSDFGLARRPDALLTQTGVAMGTPSYMAPEQARGEVRLIGPATDVYGLGAILYECLGRRPPFQGATPLETMRLLQDSDPTPVTALRPEVPRDLATICHKCLAREPAQRYATAQALADDLQRFLDGRPIVARPTGWTERLALWARRRPTLAGLYAALLLAVALGGVALATAWLWQEAETARQDADAARASAEEERAAALEARHQADQERAAAVQAREQTAAALAREAAARQELDLVSTFERVELARQEVRGGTIMRARRLLDDCPAHLRSWEWHHVRRQTAIQSYHHSENYEVHKVRVRPDSRLVAAACGDGCVRLWDAGKGTLVRTLQGHKLPVADLAFTPDGRGLVSVSGSNFHEPGQPGEVLVWDLTEERPGRALPWGKESAWCVALSPDGSRVAVGGFGDVVKVWELATGQEVATLPGAGEGTQSLAFSPDGQRLVGGTITSPLPIWDLAKKARVASLAGPTAPVRTVAYSPDGALVVAGGWDRTVRFWKMVSGEAAGTFSLPGPRNCAQALAFSPDGRRLAVGRHDRAISILSVSRAEELLRLQGHELPVFGVAFASDGRRLVSGGAGDGRGERVGWDLGMGTGEQQLGPSGAHALAFDPRQPRLISGSNQGAVQQHNLRTGRLLNTFRAHEGRITGLALAPNGQHLATCGEDKRVKVWERSSRKLLWQSEPLPGHVTAVAYSPDGQRVAASHWGMALAQVQVWDAATGQLQHALPVSLRPGGVVFSPDGRWLAAGDAGRLRLWDVTTGAERWAQKLPGGEVASLAFSPDGARLACGLWGRPGPTPVFIHDAATGTVERELVRHYGAVWAVAYSPDGRRVASGGADGVVNLWDVASGRLAFALRTEAQEVRCLAFTPDGRRLAMGGGAKALIWEAAAEAPVPPP